MVLTDKSYGISLMAAVLTPERVNCYVSPMVSFLWDWIEQCFRPDWERCPKPKLKPIPAGSGLMRCDGCQTSPRLRSSRSTLYARGSAPAHCGTDSAYGAQPAMRTRHRLCFIVLTNIGSTIFKFKFRKSTGLLLR